MPKDPKLPKKEKKMVVKEVAKALNKGAMHRKITGSNPYAALLLDPWSAPPAFIPDDNMADTAYFSVVKRLELPVNAAGICGIRLGGYHANLSMAEWFVYGLVPHLELGPGGEMPTGTLDWVVGQTCPSLATANNLFNSTLPGWGTPDAVYFDQSFGTSSGPSVVPKYFTHARLVSAGVQAQYTGTALDSKGLLIAAFSPKLGETSSALPDPVIISVANLLALKDSQVAAVNTLQGIRCRYKPSDPMCFKFLNQGLRYDSQDTEQADSELAQGEMFIVATGCTPGATFHIDCIFHYEGLVASNQFQLVDTHKTMYSPSQMAVAHNVNSVVPATKPISFTAEQQQKGGSLPQSFGSVVQSPLNSIANNILSGHGLFGGQASAKSSSGKSSTGAKSSKSKNSGSMLDDDFGSLIDDFGEMFV